MQHDADVDCFLQLPPAAYLAETRQLMGEGCDCCILANPSLPQAQLLEKVSEAVVLRP